MTHDGEFDGRGLEPSRKRRCVYDLQRRANAVLRTIVLLDVLNDDTLWSDSCTVAKCIQDIAGVLGWHHEGLVAHMLFNYNLANAPLDDWSYDQMAEVLRRIANGVTGHPANTHGGEVPEAGVTIALHALKGELTDQTAMLVLGNLTRIAAAFKARDVLLRPRLHPRVLATMDAIWEAASWVDNEELEAEVDEARCLDSCPA